jgi:S1-C subfamily serine protease
LAAESRVKRNDARPLLTSLAAVNGRVITGVDDLHRMLSGLPVARQLLLSVIRENRMIEVPIELRLGQ